MWDQDLFPNLASFLFLSREELRLKKERQIMVSQPWCWVLSHLHIPQYMTELSHSLSASTGWSNFPLLPSLFLVWCRLYFFHLLIQLPLLLPPPTYFTSYRNVQKSLICTYRLSSFLWYCFFSITLVELGGRGNKHRKEKDQSWMSWWKI